MLIKVATKVVTLSDILRKFACLEGEKVKSWGKKI